MSNAQPSIIPLDQFLLPIIRLPAWGVKQGHGSFLTFEFGEPKLQVREYRSEAGLRRSAYVHGQAHLLPGTVRWLPAAIAD